MESIKNDKMTTSIDVAALIQTVIDNQKKDQDVHWTVKVFGGVVVSITAIAIIGAFQSAFQGISECNRNIQHQSSLMQTKENIRPIWENIKEIRTELNEFTAMKERIKLLEQQNKDLQIELQKIKDKK